jgi:hypothetical protein
MAQQVSRPERVRELESWPHHLSCVLWWVQGYASPSSPSNLQAPGELNLAGVMRGEELALPHHWLDHLGEWALYPHSGAGPDDKHTSEPQSWGCKSKQGSKQAGELAQTLTGCNTCESRTSTLTEQHSGAGSGGMGAGGSTPRAWEQEGWPCLLLMEVLGGLARAGLESSPWWYRWGRANTLTSYYPGPNPGLCEWLSWIKRQVLLIQSCKISMTQGNNRITERSPGEDPILTMSQKPEISNQINDSLQWIFTMNIAMNMCGQRDTLWDKLWHSTASIWDVFMPYLCCCSFVCVCVLFWGRGCQGEGWIWGDGKVSRAGVHDVKLKNNE